jgi:hypothetical protein
MVKKKRNARERGTAAAAVVAVVAAKEERDGEVDDKRGEGRMDMRFVVDRLYACCVFFLWRRPFLLLLHIFPLTLSLSGVLLRFRLVSDLPAGPNSSPLHES